MNQDASTGNGPSREADTSDPGYTEKFPPTSGRVMGVVAVALCALVVVYALLDGDGGFAAPVAWGAAFAGVLSYAALLRPAVRVESGALVLRNMVDTNQLPLASIEEVAVGQVLAVRTEEKRYVSPAIGTSFLRTIRPRPAQSGLTYPEYVRDRILHLADGARRRGGEVPPACRTWAWPEIAGLLVTGAGFVAAVVA